MHSALKPIIRAALYYLLSVLAIAVVLLVGSYLVDGIKGAISARDRLELMLAVQDQVDRYRQEQEAGLRARLGEARRLPLAAVDARIRAVTRELADTRPAEAGDLAILLEAGPGQYASQLASQFASQLASRYQARLARAFLIQELAYLQQVRAHLFALQSRQAAQAELGRLHERHRAAYARVLQKRQEVDRLGWVDAQRMQYAWARSAKLDRLAAEVRTLTAENNRAAGAYRAQAQALRRMQTVTALGEFALDQQALDRVLGPLEEQLAEARAAVSSNALSRLAAPLREVLPLAIFILVAAIAGRAAIRAFFYFALAPVVTRGAPLRLDEGNKDLQAGQGDALPPAITLLSPSAVSQTLELAPDQELLVLPSYLQSAPVGAARSTRWLIRERPWASLTAGMAMLTCVRTRGGDDQVVLSASDDGLSEIALLRIPAGQALAIQPRALVGLVARRDAPVDIRWHWRLGSLHAWLTLQLRYFVMRGPLTLAVQGRRGVRVQEAWATQAIRQTATLGFSTDVDYSTVRSAPFLPYLRGQAPLLYDRFGGAGIYLYDETPGAGKAGRLRRGLEGVTDALLKLVGY